MDEAGAVESDRDKWRDEEDFGPVAKSRPMELGVSTVWRRQRPQTRLSWRRLPVILTHPCSPFPWDFLGLRVSSPSFPSALGRGFDGEEAAVCCGYLMEKKGVDFQRPLRKISADRRIMESRSVEEEERDVKETWDERALTLISDHIEGEGESSECWSMSCLAQFRK